MPQSRERVKAELMKEAERLIDRMLDEKRPADEITLDEIVRAALRAGAEFERSVVEQLAANGQSDTSLVPACPRCGRPMVLKGSRRRRVETQAGEMELKRAYYTCADCQQGLFPPG